MHTTRAVPSKQDLQTTLNTTGVFNLITDDRFIGTVEAHLPEHRERTYPPVETLAMSVAQVLSDDSSCQRAVNERIVRCLQQGMRAPSTSTAAYCEARVRLPSVLVESLYKAIGEYASDNAPSASLWCKRRALFIDGTGTTMPDTPGLSIANVAINPECSSRFSPTGSWSVTSRS